MLTNVSFQNVIENKQLENCNFEQIPENQYPPPHLNKYSAPKKIS